jgi:hypothetical protein
MFTLAADGKASKQGMPNPLRLAVIARITSTTYGCRSSSCPPAGGLALGAPVGKAFGYREAYVAGLRRKALHCGETARSH